jgi:hypothetical protein
VVETEAEEGVHSIVPLGDPIEHLATTHADREISVDL